MTKITTAPDFRKYLNINILFFLFFLLLSLQMSIFGQEDLYGNKLVSDNLGNSYVAGNFRNSTLTFGNFILKNYGGSDIFLAKYDSHGKVIWAKNIGGQSDEKILFLKVDNNGSISISASSKSKEINYGNNQIKNDDAEIIFNDEVNTNGNLLSSKIEKIIVQSSNNNSSKSNAYMNTTSSADTTLSLVLPAVGDNWKVGTKGVIQWNSENIINVLIELSIDNGTTWQKIYKTAQFDLNQYIMVVPNTPSDSCLIRISNYDNPAVSDTSSLFSIYGKLYWEIKESGYNSVLRNIYNFDSTTWAVGFNGLVKSTDKGDSWLPQLTGYGLLDIFFLNHNMGWTVGLNGSIFRTTNGGADWTQIDNDFNFHFEKVFFTDSLNGYMIGKNYFLKTIDGGKSWSSQQPTDHIIQTMFFVNKDTGWIAGNEGVILKTTDAGATWAYQQLNGTNYGTLTSLYFLDENTGWACGSGLDITGGVILKTNNGGINWNLQHNGFNRFIYSIYFSNCSSGWAVGDEGIMFNTTDGGSNWVLQGSGTFSDLYSVNTQSSQNGWSVGNDGVILKYIKDSDSAVLPVELSGFEVNQKGNSIELNWQTATEVNNKGFEIERKFSGDWITIGFRIGNGTTTSPVKYIYKDDLNNISHSGNIIYRLKQIDYNGTYKYSKEISVNFNSVPEEYSLLQNYPNPFNPTTVIKYSVKENTQVVLKVFDILGREVSTLINEEKQPGAYTVNFDAAAAGLSSGTYFYTIKAGNFVQTKKMLLLK